MLLLLFPHPCYIFSVTEADLYHGAADAEGPIPAVLSPGVIQCNSSSAPPGLMHGE